MKTIGIAVALGTMVVLFSGGSSAATTATLTVSVTVRNSCAVSSGGGTLAFGVYDPVGANTAVSLTQSSGFQIQCSNGTAAAIALSQGSNPSAASTDAAPIRNLTNGNAKLNYQLYSSAAQSKVWDNVHSVSQTGSGMPQTVTIYGVISPGQNVPPGTYTDTVTITVSY
jgi:spore coat protein U-like protein